MVRRISRFSIAQTAKVFGVLYALLGLVFLPFMLVAALLAPDEIGFGVGIALLIPVFYGALGFITTAIGCWIYNVVAGLVGGIEVELDQALPDA